MEEGADLVGIDFILNVVLDDSRRVIAATAGHVRDAHRAACDVVDRMGAIALDRPYDLVIVALEATPKTSTCTRPKNP